MMLNMEIMEEFAGCNVDQIIVKGKRTKRPRPSYSTTSSGGDGGSGVGDIWSAVSSPTTSSEISTSTEEDEDMANCLILLARGGFPPGEMAVAPEKFSGRKFTQMAATANGSKVGIFLYECKTCSRTFPSFQALGGHRASHKKPKSAADNDRKKSPPADNDQEDEEEAGKFTGLNHIIAAPTSSELTHKTLQLGNKPKIHECSICGSEFASGQALGGHMRRHRSATNTSPQSPPHDVSEKPRKNVLALDLNLPAPPEDDLREMNLNQFPVNQQPRFAVSAATLVDCHY